MQPRNFVGDRRIVSIALITSSSSAVRSSGRPLGQASLGQSPNSLIRVEVRGVGGERLDAETRMLTEELWEGFPLMGRGVIQENDEGAAQVPQQLTQEHTDSGRSWIHRACDEICSRPYQAESSDSLSINALLLAAARASPSTSAAS